MRKSNKAGNKTDKERLAPTILQAENQLEELANQPHELEKKARNAEVIFLRNKR